MKQPIQLTPKAKEHFVKSLANQSGAIGIKVGLEEAGCSGQTYVINFASELGENDKTYDCEGVTVIISDQDLVHLAGTEIDFVEKELGVQIVFNNPNVANACGCGESVQFKADN